MSEPTADRPFALAGDRGDGGAGELADAYALIAELWCCPTGVDAVREEVRADAGRVIERLSGTHPEAADALARFLAAPAVTEEEYIDLFELQPRCPLYLGSHVYDEPKTCAGAGVSDRNEYMIELVGIYRHFGRAPNCSELPDYLPLVVECLAFTAGAKDDPVRIKLLRDYVQPFLPPVRTRLRELGTPYLHLAEALVRLVASEAGALAAQDRSEMSDAR
jgi:nitrate reductase delta subunit